VLTSVNLGGGCPDRRLEPAELPRDGLPQVLQQVEAVSDLACLWCTLTGRVGIKAIAIAVDNLDFRMLPEPICHPVCRAIGKQIHHTAALQVRDNRAEFRALPPSPLIDTGDPDRGSFERGPGMRSEGRPPAL